MAETRAAGKAEPVNVRNLALEVIIQTMERGEYCDKALHDMLNKHAGLPRRDRAFMTRLVEGTVERCLELDYVIDHYSKTPVDKMKPAMRGILRMSVYQILYMDQVPDSAACNEGVKLTVKRRMMPLRGFANGILRNVARYKDDIPYPMRKTNLVRHLSVWNSMPEWIVRRFLEEYGEKETEKLLAGFMREDRQTTVRCNVHKASVKDTVDSLKAQGANVEMGKLFPYALRISDYGKLTDLDAFKNGWIQVQDESSMLDGAVSKAKKEDFVLDVCAAPGGKSIHVADIMEGEGKIIACDINNAKVSLIRENLIRTGIHNVKLKKNDALVLNEEWVGKADIVIADLPCSGLGVMNKKCDIKYKTQEKDIKSLAGKQQRMLKVVSQYVKPGGTLIYSTCTITPEENQENREWILKNLPFQAVSIEEELPEKLKGSTGKEGYIQVLPDVADTDGFFVSKFLHIGG